MCFDIDACVCLLFDCCAVVLSKGFITRGDHVMVQVEVHCQSLNISASAAANQVSVQMTF